MPRHARLDVLGCIYHVISRGIERRKIFRDERDREEFLRRLSESLEESGTQCYAWVLMDNHFHLLLRPLRRPLSHLMRRVLTGYVVCFNHKYRRTGHLFQNRYKSILCQEDPYFKELIRYIHLNPVRAGMVETPSALKHYPWTGHGALLGLPPRCHQEVGEVLSLFGGRRKEARSRYLEFVTDGWSMGHRQDLMGGGLLRSAGGVQGVKALRMNNEWWQSDNRILGDGDFVSSMLKLTNEEDGDKRRLKSKYNLDTLGIIVSKEFEVPEGVLFSGRRFHHLTTAKSVYAYLANEYLGIPLIDVGRRLKMSCPAAFKCRQNGEQILGKERNRLKKLIS